MSKYDIFISYRRRDAGMQAESLINLLEPNYKRRVSFDRLNLTGIFDVELAKRIDQCKDFLLVIDTQAFTFKEKDFDEEQVALYEFFANCTLEEFDGKIKELLSDNVPIDFVRIEIARALHRKVNIIPIVPEGTETFSFGRLRLPPDIIEIQRHDAVLYSNHPDRLFRDVIPEIRGRLVTSPDSPIKKVFAPIVACLLLLTIICSVWAFAKHRKQERIEELKNIKVLNGEQSLNWYKDISLTEIEAAVEILTNMVKVEGGSYRMGAAPNAAGDYDKDVDKELETPQIAQRVETFWIGKYETSVSEWHRIMGEEYDKEYARAPIANVSYGECTLFAEKLSDLTGLDFQLPTEAEWEYAARGGNQPDTTKYAGSNNPDIVAWYGKNSGGSAHVRNDNNGGLYCNNLDLYDMSGNVSEWCNCLSLEKVDS